MILLMCSSTHTRGLVVMASHPAYTAPIACTLIDTCFAYTMHCLFFSFLVIMLCIISLLGCYFVSLIVHLDLSKIVYIIALKPKLISLLWRSFYLELGQFGDISKTEVSVHLSSEY